MMVEVAHLTLDLEPWLDRTGNTWRASVTGLDLAMVVRRYEREGKEEVWAFLLFPCCGTNMTAWQNCDQLGEHPVPEDGVALTAVEFEEFAGPLELTLLQWVQHACPHLDPLQAQIAATSIELLLRGTDWTSGKASS